MVDTEEGMDPISHLGEPLAEFRVGGRWLIQKLIVAPLLVLLGLAIDIGILWVGAIHFLKLLIIGLLLSIGGFMIAVRTYRSRGLRVLVYPEGLVQLQRSQNEAFFWDEIVEVRRKKVEGHWAWIWQGAKILTLKRTNGRQVAFDDSLPKLEELGQIVENQSLPYLLPPALDQLETGATLQYGKLRLDLHGLVYEKELLPWREIKEIKVSEDSITISKKGKWLTWQSVSADGVANYHVFRALVGYMLRRNGAVVKSAE